MCKQSPINDTNGVSQERKKTTGPKNKNKNNSGYPAALEILDMAFLKRRTILQDGHIANQIPNGKIAAAVFDIGKHQKQ